MISYEPKEKTLKKKAIKIICIILFVTALILLLLYVFNEIPVSYDEIESGIEAVEEDGIIHFEFYLTDAPGGMFMGDVSPPILTDPETGIEYIYHGFQFRCSRWNRWVHPGKMDNPYLTFTKEGESQQNSVRYLRIYYINPDGSLVLIWEHPDAEAIIERALDAVPPPEKYLGQFGIGS